MARVTPARSTGDTSSILRRVGTLMDLGLIVKIAGLLGLNAKTLFEKYKGLSESTTVQFEKEMLAGQLAAAARVYQEGLHMSFLERFYDKTKLEGLGMSHVELVVHDKKVLTGIALPISLKAQRLELGGSTESHILVDQVEPAKPSLQADEVAWIVSDIKRRDLKVWDQAMYRLMHVKIANGQLSATFALDRFMRYRVGCGALQDELVRALVGSNFDVSKLIAEPLKWLPFRMKLLPDVASLANLPGRLCVGGIQACIAIRRPKPWNDFVIPVQRRSSVTSEGQGLMSPIPCAFHQPCVDPLLELEFRKTFLREVFEELFGGEEAIGTTRHLQPDWYLAASEPIKWITDNEDDVALSFTDCCFNAISGNYEVVVTCVIESTSFWKKYATSIKANWEVSDSLSPLVSTRETKLLERLLGSNEVTGSGKIALARTLQFLSESDPVRVKAPEFSIV